MADFKVTDIYIDTEFNGFMGDLTSMALVVDEKKYFYEVVNLKPGVFIDEWVKENVMPILNKKAVTFMTFQNRLHTFLAQFDAVNIIADWHEDIAHFCNVLTTGPGERIPTPKLFFEIKRNLGRVPSELHHNALADAIGNFRSAKLIEYPVTYEFQNR